MDMARAALLFAAGFGGGVAASIAGGASLITFPTLLGLGLPPVAANATNAVGLSLSNFMAAVADWRRAFIGGHRSHGRGGSRHTASGRNHRSTGGSDIIAGGREDFGEGRRRSCLGEYGRRLAGLQGAGARRRDSRRAD